MSDITPRSAVRPRPDWVAAVLAVIFAGLVVAGSSFKADNSSAWFTSSAAAVVGSLVAGLFVAALSYLGLVLLFRWLDGRWDAGTGSARGAGTPGMRAALRRWLVPTWLALLAGWFPWLVIHYPGNVDSDTITQLFEWLGLSQRSDHHPWFDTMVFGWFWDLGHLLGSYTYGLFAMLVLQELLTALGFAVALTYLGRLGLSPRARWTLTVLVAVSPVFFITPSVLSKDSFAGIFWTPFLVVFTEALRTRARVLVRARVGAGAVILTTLLILAQRPNLYLLVLCAVALILVAARGTRVRIAGGVLAAVLVATVVWGMILLPAWRVQPGGLGDALSVPLQQTARTVRDHGSALPASERRAIDAVVGYDGLAKAYVPTRSDAVKARLKAKATRRQQLDYARVWFSEMLRFPGTYLAATFNTSYEYFAPLTRVNFQTNLALARYIPFWHSLALPGTSTAQIADVADSLHSPRWLAGAQRAVNDETGAFMDSTMLLSSKALYASWIPLIALGMGLRRRNWFHLLALLPVLVNLAILVAGPIALARYAIPSIYGSVLAVGLLLLPTVWEPRTLAGASLSTPERRPRVLRALTRRVRRPGGGSGRESRADDDTRPPVDR